ncbi:uncharacterized protein LOC114761108 [Neltuma alba]|uniref:uncharacterized protein LOC114757207 n=1 Tax=Neltuma alba TaxID=207710 RepID=UPI0010A35571|nr:uncharacterized protein LOC114757207 [Prosopis alba]XP_028806257.1 uncharacterized protein LOC114761108 [Prosopis alba]
MGFVTVVLPLLLSLAVQGTLGGVECEGLGKEKCSFAVSSAGKRCVLEKIVKRSGMEAYICRSSEIEADKLMDHIESDQCVEACGLDRMSLGISSDSLIDSNFTKKLCSTECYHNCPNVVDLYSKLAEVEGVFLPKLCEAKGADAKRAMADVKSSGAVAA